MSFCFAQKIKYAGITWFAILCSENMSLLEVPTKYLKHKTREHCSPNTVQKIAYSIAYYYCFLHERDLTVEAVLKMKYSAQHDHFVEFLCWVQSGNNSDRNRTPNNATCNSYLQAVFGFYEFLLLENENAGEIRVLEDRDISYSGAAGVRFRRSVKAFRGYLPEEEHVGRTIEKAEIQVLLEASDSLRTKLLILLLAETGFRIGEILGIRYAKDIDFDKHTIQVSYREDNENGARAKNAEIRRAKISNETFELLLVYISENRILLSKTGYLFVNLSGITKGKPMNVNAVNSAFALLEKKTGIKVTSHMFRHFFANERRKNGWSMDMISKALGHKRIATTEKYMNIEEEEMSEAMDQYYLKNGGLYDVKKII